MTFRIVANSCHTSPLKSHNGVLQGDSLSPLLFNLFVADLPKSLSHSAPKLDDIEVPYMQYADNLPICATNAAELQKVLDDLKEYFD